MANIDRLLNLECLMQGVARGGTAPATALDVVAFAPDPADATDLLLDLCGDSVDATARGWRLTFDGAAGETALLPLLLAGRSPHAEISEDGRAIAAGRLGSENRGSLLATMLDAQARLTTLILAAFAGAAPDVPALPSPEGAFERKPLTTRGVAIRAAKQAARSALRRVYRLRYDTPHWKVGWRRLDGPDLMTLRAHPAEGWRILPDDGSRFYADPFPIEHDGRVTMFVEDFPHRTGKGVISAVAFDADGPVGRPEPVLELPYHLSYPFVFARDGEVWMVPESCAAGTIDLFRATDFPGGWVKHATLVGDIVASDATLLEHEGRWWMFATVRDGGGAFSDALHLWSAPDFRGPWTAHRKNPVLIDIASARPAGRIVARNGVLMRPVQDCREGYGAALGFARIDRLDDEGFTQTLETILTAGPLWPGRRLHTLNTAGGFEFIDGSARAAPRRRP
jgi:hypothetical protein